MISVAADAKAGGGGECHAAAAQDQGTKEVACHQACCRQEAESMPLTSTPAETVAKPSKYGSLAILGTGWNRIWGHICC